MPDVGGEECDHVRSLAVSSPGDDPRPLVLGVDPTDNHAMPESDRLNRLLTMLEAEPGDAFCLYGIAQEHAKADDHDVALDWYDRAITADPDDGYLHFHKARSLEALDRMAEAIDTVEAGLAAARRGGDAHAQSELEALRMELGG
jgi:tetratricopeptide (TPR) repeat protein